MAIAAATCCFSSLTSSFASRFPASSSQRGSAISDAALCFVAPKATNHQNHNRGLKKSSPPASQNSREKEVSKKSFFGRSKDEGPNLYPDGNSGRGSQPTAFKSPGMPKKDRKDLMVDMKEQQIGEGILQDAACFNAVVKVYCTHTEPDYSLPWQKQRQFSSTGSAFMIGDGKLLTNAHCVEHGTQIKVKKRGDDTKYVAKVLARGVDCDIALLSVENEEFWKGAETLQFGHLPHLQDAVTVVGYPLGGDTISVTKGVVSRIEVTSYAHGSTELLGIQIDAAINPGNSGGPAFNDQGECIGVAFQAYRSDEAENIGYVIPTTVVLHFLTDFERNRKYTGFPCLGVLVQKLENPALRTCLKLQSNEGVLVRRVEPIADANNVLKEGDVIVSFDDVRVGSEGTVPFRSTERIAFRYLISQKFAGDVAELGIFREGSFMKVNVTLNPRVHLVPYQLDRGQPSYFITAGLVFTPLSEPLIDEEEEDSLGLKLMTKSRYSLARFKGEQIVILSQVLAHEVNIGYEDMDNQQVLKFNGTRIKNIHHLAHLVDSCKDQYLIFEFEDTFLAVLERETATAASSSILKDYRIPSERSSDLSEPYVDSLGDEELTDQGIGDSPVDNDEIGFDGLLWV